MRKRRVLAVLAALLLLLAACGGEKEPREEVHAVGDKITTAFFEYTVSGVSAQKRYQGKTAREGNVFVVVWVEIENKENYTLPMGRYDFQLQWGDGEDSYRYPIHQYCQEQLPDEYDIPQDEGVEGTLVFQVPREETDLALGYLEIFENDRQGDLFFTYFSV